MNEIAVPDAEKVKPLPCGRGGFRGGWISHD